ncbi:MAG: tetratricopeptide repeat protein [Vicingus serpentipes]|nr:tetratricopeptide repeat protein [Vicingus serpentipes]
MVELEKGKALFEQQQYKEAIEVLNIFLLQQNNNADALYTRAISYRKIGEFEKSIDDFSTILERLPDEPSLLSERGVSHFHNKNINAAMNDMNRAVELEPNKPYRYASRAYIRANIDIEGAIEDYKKAIELDPKDDIAHNNLALLEENAGRMSSAKNHFNAANKIIGYHPKKGTEINNSTSSIGKVMLEIFTSKNTRKEYFNFLKSFFKNNP